ncbi:hypothetical protein Syun_017178 [Stephania yunnanensis]|uniref:Uncharacterized protein n=1 Tax=Stephania yunnanensis TaxID=152371 RepID=A0AAP0P5L1_9MAGN
MHSYDEEEQSITTTKKGRGPARPSSIWGSGNKLVCNLMTSCNLLEKPQLNSQRN